MALAMIGMHDSDFLGLLAVSFHSGPADMHLLFRQEASGRVAVVLCPGVPPPFQYVYYFYYFCVVYNK